MKFSCSSKILSEPWRIFSCLKNFFLFLEKNLKWTSALKGKTLCFSTKKSAVRLVFKCKHYLKNSIEFIKKKKKKIAVARVNIFFVTHISGKKSIFLVQRSAETINLCQFSSKFISSSAIHGPPSRDFDGEIPHAALEFSHSNKPSRHLDRDFKTPPMKHVQIALFHQNSRQPYFYTISAPWDPYPSQ